MHFITKFAKSWQCWATSCTKDEKAQNFQLKLLFDSSHLFFISLDKYLIYLFRLTSAAHSTSTRSCGNFNSSIESFSTLAMDSSDGRSEKLHRKSDNSIITTSKIERITSTFKIKRIITTTCKINLLNTIFGLKGTPHVKK